ncbi:MAG: hypothetical protein ACTSVD_03160 [Candidatus Thorarchaeota archaeon]
MKWVTWILRILSTATFAYMCYIVYNQLSGYWDWNAPYTFIVTVFRILSLLLFYLCVVISYGVTAAVVGGQTANTLATGIYNSLILRFWYLQPYGFSGPMTNVYQVLALFQSRLLTILWQLYDLTFTFLYFLFAGIGIAMFLQSLVRMEHKFVGGAFLSIQAIMIAAAFRGLPIYGESPIMTDFISFLTSGMQILALVSFAYLEVSYQMIYSYSVGKPVEDREETLKKQLLALRSATRKQDAIERGEKITSTTTSRWSGATAFSFLREVIERKVLGSREALENLDAISDVRRLNIYVDELLTTNPKAKDELTARAAAPSSTYVITSTVTGSVIRFLSVVVLSFILMNPVMVVSLLRLPPGIANSVELRQPEIVVLLLVPVVLLFAFVAATVRWLSKSEIEARIELAEKESKERERKKRELERKRKIEEARRHKRKPVAHRGGVERDEWDAALDEIYKE